MKKLNLLLIILTAGLLVVSCGKIKKILKGRKPEVKEAAKAAGDGMFGSTGEKMIYLMDDLALMNEEYEEQGKKLKEQMDKLRGKKSDSEFMKITSEASALERKKEQKEEEIFKKFSELVEDIKGKKLPTEIAEDAPLKLIEPFKIVGSGTYGDEIEMEGKVELATDRPAIRGWNDWPKFTPTIVFVDDNGNELYSRYLSCKQIDKYNIYLPKGFSENVRFTISMTSEKDLPKVLAAKRIIIRWDKPYGNVSQPVAVTTPEEPIDEGMDDYDDEYDGGGEEGLLGSLPQGTTVYEGDMGGFPIVFTIVRNDYEGGVKATYKNVKYGTVMHLIGESLPAMGGDISFIGSDNGKEWHFDLTGNAQNITGTASGDGKNLNVRLHRKR